MAKKFSELEKKMSPSRLARAKVRAKDMIADMLLSEIRKKVGLPQTELAKTLGLKKTALSKLEKSQDLQVDTLRRIIQALGGELELVAHLPGGDIRLSQFRD